MGEEWATGCCPGQLTQLATRGSSHSIPRVSLIKEHMYFGYELQTRYQFFASTDLRNNGISPFVSVAA